MEVYQFMEKEITMLHIPDQIKTASHRLVSSLYRTMDYSHHSPESVLVIETQFPDSEDEHESFDTYLLELLSDLKNLKAVAERTVGKIDRIDIRTQ
jgi:hypothetical protein